MDLYIGRFLCAFRGKRKREARGKNTARSTAVTSTDHLLSLSLVFTRFLVFRALSNEAWIHMVIGRGVTGYR